MKALGTKEPRLYKRLTVGLLVAAGVYGWYVTTQYGRINDLNQRELSNASAELGRAIQNSVETVNQLKRSVKNPTTSKSAPSVASDNGPPLVAGSRVCSFDDDQPYLTIVPEYDCARNVPIYNVNVVPTSPLGIHAETESPETRAKPQYIRFAFDTGKVLRELSIPDSFGLILIGKDDGSVLYQDAPAKRVWVGHLRWGEQQFRDSGADTFGSLRVENLQSVLGEDKETGWPRLQSMSTRTSARLGGQLQELYLEPLVLENPDGKKVNLVLAAAVPIEAIVRQALAVDSYFLAALVFVFLLLLFGFPFIKLLSLDAHERFTLADVTRLYLSTAALVVLFTFATLAVDSYVRWHEVADQGLKDLATRLDHDFVEEVARIQGALARYDRETAAAKSAEALGQLDLVTDWIPDPVDLEQVAWIDPDGRQIWKMTADHVTNRTDVQGRVYFQAVRDGYLFVRRARSEPFYVGPERSITDGKFYTFVSMPSHVASSDRGNGYVAAATARLFSLDSPSLPAGYGFVLVNREGRVLYHSDARLSLRENLFDELGDGARARGMVYAGHAGDMNSGYRERPHEFYFLPLSLRRASDSTPSGFYMVTFRDTSLECAVAARVFLIALFGPMLLLLSLICLAVLAMAAVPIGRHERWSVWLWPHGGLVPMYRALSAPLAVLLTVSLAALWTGNSEAVIVATPLLAVVTAVGWYALATRKRRARTRLASTAWFVTVFLLFLACAVVVPASALFRAALAHEFGRFVATGQNWVQAQRNDLPSRAKAVLRAARRTGMVAEEIAIERKGVVSARPGVAPFDAELTKTRPTTDWLLTPFHWADEYLPVESQQAALQHYEESELSYAPHGVLTAWGLLAFTATILLLAWWIHWKARSIFFADQQTVDPGDALIESRWAACTPEERCVLFQIARDHVANPHQGVVVKQLIAGGLLTLDPELRPTPRVFAEATLPVSDGEPQNDLDAWELSAAGHGWRYLRMALLSGAAAVGLFLIATQPGLQSGLLGIATGLTGALTALVKLREAVGTYFSNRKVGA